MKFFFHIFLAMLRGGGILVPLTREQTCTPAVEEQGSPKTKHIS